jgi:D-aminopeptidase
MDAPWIGSAPTWELMKSAQTLANGTSTGYGLGLFIGRYRGIGTLHHSGGGLGANSQMLKVPAAGLDIVVMVNRHDVKGLLLANKILDSCLPDLDPIDRPRVRPVATGTFRSRVTGRVIQLYGTSNGPVGDEVKQTVSVDGSDFLFEPATCGDNVLRPTGVADYLKLALTLKGDPQEPTSIRLDDYGNVDELAPISTSKDKDVNKIVGLYCLNMRSAQCTISEAANELRLETKGFFGSTTYNLEYLGEELWRAKPTQMSRSFIQGILRLDEDGGGFRFSTNGTLSVWFRRCT